MSLAIFDWSKFSWGLLGTGTSLEIAGWTLGEKVCYRLTGQNIGSLVNKIIPRSIQKALMHTGDAIGKKITGPAINQMECAGVLTNIVLGPLFEEMVFRCGIQQSIIAGLDTALQLGGIQHPVAFTAARGISISLTAYLFVTSHDHLYGQKTLETLGGSRRFVRALIRGVVVENGTIYEAVGMHIIHNLIAHIYDRIILVRTILEE